MAFSYMQTLVENSLPPLDNALEDENESDVDFQVESGENDDDSDAESSGDAPDDVEPRSRSRSRPVNEGTAQWCTGDELVQVSDKVKPFEEFSGAVHDLSDDATALDYFKLFISDEMFETMATETNRYAAQQQERAGKRDTYWKPVDVGDIMKYVYINIMFGLHELPELKLYWSSDPKWRVPAVADVMGRQRFEKIHSYFHLNNNDLQVPRGEDGFDPLFKFRPLLDNVRSACGTVYKPEKKLSVDEAMIGYTGRLSFKQYIQNKPTPWGIKLWCLAETDTGYVLNFKFYTGKEDISPAGQGYDVVMLMVQPYLDKCHHVYYDNFFSSVKLAEDLLVCDTYSCGTMRPNRKGWPLPKSKQKKGDATFKQRGLVVAVQWTDKRQVNVLSTQSDPVMTTIQRRTKGGMIDHIIPAPVLSYNNGMFGVDLSDQYRSYYNVGRPGTKWWRYCVWYLVQVSIVNAFRLNRWSNPFAKRSHPAGNHLSFRSALVDQLLAAANRYSNSALIRAPAAAAVDNNPAMAGRAKPYSPNHQSIKMSGRHKRCYQCAIDGNKMPSGRTRETTHGCHLCGVHLHPGQCYAKFHEQLKEGPSQ